MPNSLQPIILDNLTTAIVVIDTGLLLRYMNPAAEALLESSGSRYLGEPLHLLFNIEDNHLFPQAEPVAFTQRESLLTLPSGHTLTVDYAVTPIQNGQQALLLIELQPLDRWLRISREEGLLSSQHHTRALLRGLAHEIKNPLGGIRGAAQILARSSDKIVSNNIQECTGIIIDEVDRLRNLVDRLLGSQQLPNVGAVNIHEVLERARHLIEAETEGSIIFQRDYDPSIPEFSGDREQLIQAILNIVRNAAQALNESATAAPKILLRTRTLRQITIGAQRHKLVCRIDIVDNGPGVPSHLRDAMFLPLISGRAEGSGLGLSISQSIINQHRGLIECDDTAEQTTFSIYIPLD
jgi:two-component system nitrogen regulation sensor histidine kinase GlnL